MSAFRKLLTPEGENILSIPHNTYPRPQLRRDSFFCLNGEWDFAITRGTEPKTFGKILVPFAPQSCLSGVEQSVKKGDVLYYRTCFQLPQDFKKERVILHFGAVDNKAEVLLNGRRIGEHIGGYLPFSFDITPHLIEQNTLTVKVWDDPRNTTYPYGKQREKRGGMWYTPVSGIWQTVWIESVPRDYIKSIKIDVDDCCAVINVDGVEDGVVCLADKTYPIKDGRAELRPEEPHLWSPDDPYLYNFKIIAGEDEVESYFALRTLSVGEVEGVQRLLLNGKPFFFHGLLDQGYFSDGIYTPADLSAFSRDILAMKRLGFNTLRKHIKIEPEQFYYDCDRLGMIVFQDMVNNGGYSFIRDTALPTVGMKRLPDRLLHPSRRARAAFRDAMGQTVHTLYNHPSICLWTIFNEGWGQFCGDAMYEHLRAIDSSRFIDTASGWFKVGKSDVESPHVYFKPVRVKAGKKPLLLSEFGGYSWRPKGHVFNPDKVYGYRFFETREDFSAALLKLYNDEIIPAAERCLCGAVYTQVSDVEDETNGLFTYDRRVLKVTEVEMLPIAERLKNIF